jgi:hypothetical protein
VVLFLLLNFHFIQRIWPAGIMLVSFIFEIWSFLYLKATQTPLDQTDYLYSSLQYINICLIIWQLLSQMNLRLIL